MASPGFYPAALSQPQYTRGGGGYYDRIMGAYGLRNPTAYSSTPTNYVPGQSQGYWPGAMDPYAARTLYNPNYYNKLLAAGQTVDPRTGRSIVGGAGAAQSAMTTLNPFVNQQTGEAQTPATPQNIDPGIFDVINSASLSNDPEYQNNLSRALFALGGGQQEVSYAEQRRMQVFQAAARPQKQKELISLAENTAKMNAAIVSFAGKQPGLPVEALNELTSQVQNKHDAQQALILQSPGVGSIADIVATQKSPEYNMAKLTEFVGKTFGAEQGEIVKSLTAGGADMSTVVKYLDTLSTNQTSLKKEQQTQMLKHSEERMKRLDEQMAQGAINKADYDREILLQHQHREFLTSGRVPAGMTAPPSAPITAASTQSAAAVQAGQVVEAKQFAKQVEKPFFATPEEVHKAVADGTLPPKAEFVDAAGVIRKAPAAEIPSARKPSAAKSAAKEESAFEKQAKLAKRKIPADLARQLLEQLQSGQ